MLAECPPDPPASYLEVAYGGGVVGQVGDGGEGRKALALWAVPRSASTGFERMMIERGDHQVIDEPYSAAYYHGPEQVSRRFPPAMPDTRYEQVAARIESACASGPVFFKDMAYHVSPVLSEDFLARYTNSFLIRDPRWTVPSMALIWPRVSLEEAGFHRLEEAFDLAQSSADAIPPLLDTNDLLADPAGVVASWCEAMEIAEEPGSLTWQAGMQRQWELWPDWYQAAAVSTGFGPRDAEQPPAVHDPELVEVIAACLPVYERLREFRLRA